MDDVLGAGGDSHLSAPRADHVPTFLLPESGAPVPVVTHGHAEQRFARSLGGVGKFVSFGGDVGVAEVLPSGRGVAVEQGQSRIAFVGFLDGAGDIASLEAGVPVKTHLAGVGKNQIGEDRRETVLAARGVPESETEVFLPPSLTVVAKKVVFREGVGGVCECGVAPHASLQKRRMWRFRKLDMFFFSRERLSQKSAGGLLNATQRRPRASS